MACSKDLRSRLQHLISLKESATEGIHRAVTPLGLDRVETVTSAGEMREKVADVCAYPFNCIGLMEITFVNRGKRTMFNGTIFLCKRGQQKYLASAAHNVFESSFTRQYADTVLVFFGRDGESYTHTIEARGEDFFFPFGQSPEIYEATGPYDYVILPLMPAVARQLPDKCFDLIRTPRLVDLAGVQFYISGYPGRDIEMPAGAPGGAADEQWCVQSFGDNLGRMDRMLLYKETTTAGMSGCPVFYENVESGLYEVFALHVGFTERVATANLGVQITADFLQNVDACIADEPKQSAPVRPSTGSRRTVATPKTVGGGRVKASITIPEFVKHFGIGDVVRLKASDADKPVYTRVGLSVANIGKVLRYEDDGDIVVDFGVEGARQTHIHQQDAEPATGTTAGRTDHRGFQVGDMVRVKVIHYDHAAGDLLRLGPVRIGSVGKIKGFDSDGDARVDFGKDGQKNWSVRLDDLELIASAVDIAIVPSSSETTEGDIKIGSKVRVKASVKKPRFEWGNAKRHSIGVVKMKIVHVNFKGRPSPWKADYDELESTDGHQVPLKKGSAVRVKRSVERPKYEWGEVTHESSGVIDEIVLLVDFPDVLTLWRGAESEMECVLDDDCSSSSSSDDEDDQEKLLKGLLGLQLHLLNQMLQ